MLPTNFYVYQYLNEDGLPYYIGKGKGKRIHAPHKFTIIPKLENRIILKDNLTEIEALELEISLIKKYGRKLDGGILDNIKINQWACLSGWNHKEETKRKISESKIGVKKTEETKAKMRKPKSKEHIEKIKLANLGRIDDGRYQKVSETMKGRPWSKARRESQNKKKIKDNSHGVA
jgi:hypothetical protein